MLREHRQQLLCLSQTSSRSLWRDKWPTGGAFPGETHLELYGVSRLHVSCNFINRFLYLKNKTFFKTRKITFISAAFF